MCSLHQLGFISNLYVCAMFCPKKGLQFVVSHVFPWPHVSGGGPCHFPALQHLSLDVEKWASDVTSKSYICSWRYAWANKCDTQTSTPLLQIVPFWNANMQTLQEYVDWERNGDQNRLSSSGCSLFWERLATFSVASPRSARDEKKRRSALHQRALFSFLPLLLELCCRFRSLVDGSFRVRAPVLLLPC